MDIPDPFLRGVAFSVEAAIVAVALVANIIFCAVLLRATTLHYNLKFVCISVLSCYIIWIVTR
jgi:hypothetical protein